MATEIEAIKCPQCGSVKVKELRTDHYQCESCGTEFVVHNDNDININVNNDSPPNTDNSKTNAKTLKVKIGNRGCLAIMVVLLILGCIIYFSFLGNSGGNSAGNANAKGNTWDKACASLFKDAQGNPYYVVVGTINSGENNNDNKSVYNMYLGLYSLKDAKPKWIKKLISSDFPNVAFRMFDDKDLYIGVGNDGSVGGGEKEIYRLDATTLSVENVKEALEKNDTNFSDGIARISFTYGIEKTGTDEYDYWGDASSGFKITTNDGKDFWYMPLIRQTYKTYSAYSNAKTKTSPNAVIKTGYSFINNSPDDNPNENWQLIKYRYKYDYGAPRDMPNFQDNNNSSHVVDYAVMDVDRKFFDPHVLDMDSAKVLIAYKPTVANDQTYVYQLLNAQNGSVITSVAPANKLSDDVYRGMLLKDGFVLLNANVDGGNNDAAYYDNSGKVINKIESTSNLKFAQVTN